MFISDLLRAIDRMCLSNFSGLFSRRLYIIMIMESLLEWISLFLALQTIEHIQIHSLLENAFRIFISKRLYSYASDLSAVSVKYCFTKHLLLSNLHLGLSL